MLQTETESSFSEDHSDSGTQKRQSIGYASSSSPISLRNNFSGFLVQLRILVDKRTPSLARFSRSAQNS